MISRNKLRMLRLSHLVLSLGWEGAQEFIAKLDPSEKREYFAPKPKPKPKLGIGP